MKYIIPKTYPWACTIASFSMVLGIDWQVIIKLIGHDGSRCPYSDPSIRVGFHFQECIEIAQQRGWTCTPIELFPSSTPGNGEETQIFFPDADGNWARFLHHLNDCPSGVIEGVVEKAGGTLIGHAVAWDGTKIYDPKGAVYSFAEHRSHKFYPRVLWKLNRMGTSNGS